jgi:hypothetical protein
MNYYAYEMMDIFHLQYYLMKIALSEKQIENEIFLFNNNNKKKTREGQENYFNQ